MPGLCLQCSQECEHGTQECVRHIMSDQETSKQPAEATAPPARPAAAPSQAAPLLMGVKLPIRVLLGRTQLSLRDVAQLGSGAVVELDCSPDDPGEVIVNGRVIAH